MIANLQNPTWRKSLMGTRNVLEAHNLHTLYTALLRLMGCAELDRRAVESLYTELTTAYDYAVTIHRTPRAYDFFIHPKSRQAVLEGLSALISADRYQEAIPWMLAMRYNVLMQYEEASQVKEYEQDLVLSQKEHTFLQRSLHKHSRWMWFRRGIVAAITIFAIIATVLGFYADVQRKEAIYQRGEAVKARRKEEDQRKQAESAQKIAAEQRQRAEEQTKIAKENL